MVGSNARGAPRPRAAAMVLVSLGLAGAAPCFAAAPYKTPYTSLGQPDLGGTWSNASLTPITRNPLFGDRATYSPADVKIKENGAEQTIAKGNLNTDPNSGTSESSSVGAYNQGWFDGGNRVMRVRGDARNSLLTTPDGQMPPKKGEARAPAPTGAGSVEAGLKAAKSEADNQGAPLQGSSTALMERLEKSGLFDNPESMFAADRCVLGLGRLAGPPMLPNTAYNNNAQFVQSRDAVVIEVEMIHDARVIRLNAKHRTDGIRPYFGDSIGYYEGPTLVVETTNLPKAQAYNGSWENLKVTERFTRVAKDRMLYQFTVEDPTMWEKPWGGEYEFTPTNGRIMEYACHEGNYAMEGVLAGAREREREAAEASRKALTAN